MKEKDLDKLFQEAADKANFNDSTAGWGGMKSKLQSGGLVTGSKPKFRFNLNSLLLLLLFLLPVLTATWYFLGRNLSNSSNISSNEKGSLLAEESALEAGRKEVRINSNSTASGSAEESSENETPDVSNNTETEKNRSNSNLIAESTSNNDLSNKQTLASEVPKSNRAIYSGNETEQDQPISGRRSSEKNGQLTSTDNILENNNRSEEDSSNTSLRNRDASLEVSSDLAASRKEPLTKADSENSNEYSYSRPKTDDSSEAKVISTSSVNQQLTNHRQETLPGNGEISNIQDRARESDDYMPYLLRRKSVSSEQIGKLESTEVKRVEASSNLIEAVVEQTQDSIIMKLSKWSFGIEFSPDWSSVGLGDVEDPGYTIGVQVEYHTSSKLSLTGGIGYSKKIYFADEGVESYPGTNPNWTVNRVNADCDVLDIPFNISYYLSGYEDSGFVFSTGLSSYIMLTEDYNIIYNDPFPEGSQFFRNENDHFFSLINASFGYRKRLSPILSLQVEPYVKIPIQGIGEGGLDLFTSGLRLALKYNKLTVNK